MVTRALWVLLWGVLLAGPVRAGYALATPPAGWSAEGTQGFFNFGRAANASVMNGRVVANVTVPVAGRAVTMPASMRFAANAARYALQGLRINPATMVAGVAISFAAEYGLEYVEQQGWLKWDERTVEGICWDTYGGGHCYASPEAAYNAMFEAGAQSWLGTWGSLPAGWTSGLGGSTSCSGSDYAYVCGGRWARVYADGLQQGQYAPGPWVYGTPGEVQEQYQRPAIGDDFDAPEENDPVPEGLPELLPVPLPVEIPVINPSADPTPIAQPWREPLGEPQPVPNTDPQEYQQPVADVKPAPTPTQPWRVDIQPRVLTGTDPEGFPQVGGVPDGGENAPTAGAAGDQPTDCDKYPEAAACKPLGEVPDVEDVGQWEVPFSITPWGNFGALTAECPAPRTVTLAGGVSLEMPFTLLCTYANGVRPLVLASAWIAAALLFVGVSRKGA